MMLSTVSWKGFGVAGAGRVWAMFSCGRINDKTQSTMPARRRCLVFMLVIIELETARLMVRVVLISTLLQQGVNRERIDLETFERFI